jgi:SAM-dependent methyltransferase
MPEDLQRQYATPDNLRARIALHACFSTNPHWPEWLFERERPPAGARVLDLGCGPGTFWRDRIEPSWTLTLADFSPGMIESARQELGDRATYAVADAQALPFADDSFDVVIANHMLYHVPDRPRAFAEIRRVLVDGGSFHASTIGRGHLAELVALVPGWDDQRYTDAFGLESGPEQLAPYFTDIRVERFEAELLVTDAEPVLAYIRSSERYAGDDLAEARQTVETAIARDGAFAIATRPGVITARAPCR